MLKRHYTRFLAGHPEALHFAAHSHHPWPDVTRAAVLEAWDDAARLIDGKWDKVFGEVVPEAQAHVARTLSLRDPRQIAFAPNTHELVSRVISALPAFPALRILTTDGEFMSFTRQAARLGELPGVTVDAVACEPFDTFHQRFSKRAAEGGHHFVFLSHVFFATGYVVPDLAGLVRAVPDPETVIMIDGYHAFMAVPTSLCDIEDRVFYVAGGYKYAQSGEGAAFLHVPSGTRLRPVYTGWFADFGALQDADSHRIAYAEDGFRFWGATFDPTGLYRMNAVMRWLLDLGVGVEHVHAHVRELQRRFLSALEAAALQVLPVESLITPRSLDRQAHFLSFAHPQAPELAAALLARGVKVDVRGTRIRFGFGPYQDEADVDRLLERLRTVAL